MNIPLTLNYLRPNQEWTLDGDDYKGLTWLSDTEKPTEDELLAAWPEAEQAKVNELAAQQQARNDAIAHAKSLGFTDAMIAVMYPNLSGSGDATE
jgi:hypothetical protein